MTEIRFVIPYRPANGSPRIARVVVDIPDLGDGDAPVGLRTRDFSYRVHAGAFWVSHRSPVTVDEFTRTGCDTDIRKFSGMDLGLCRHPFVEDRQPVAAIAQGGRVQFEVDGEEMSPKFIASDIWTLVKEQASRTVIVDGTFHARTIGPVLSREGKMVHWRHPDPESHRSRQWGETFGWAETEVALDYLRRSTTGEGSLHGLSGVPEPCRDDLPQQRVTDKFLEWQADVTLNRVDQLPVKRHGRAGLPATLRLRQALEARVSGFRYGLGRQGSLRHHSDPGVPGASVLIPLVDDLATTSDRNWAATMIAPAAERMRLRLESARAQGALPSEDDDALSAAFR